MYLSLYCKGSKRVTQGLRVRGSWRPNITEIFWPHFYDRHIVSFSFFWCSTGALGSILLGAGFLYCILSASLDPKLHRGFPRAPSAGCGFPYHTSSLTPSDLQLHWLSNSTELYNRSTPRRPLDLWNRMFNRHQAVITVMQFRGHSLPVYQSMSVPWEFFCSSHFISQFPPTRFPLITAIRICHLLPVHHLGMAFLAGSKGQNITVLQLLFSKYMESFHILYIFQRIYLFHL